MNKFIKKDFSTFKFFAKPCFTCINFNWEAGEGEYGSGVSYGICNADNDTYGIYEKWQEEKEEFPNCECPKRCIRKRVFQINTNFDYEDECDYYQLLESMSNYESKTHETAYNIAANISNFNTRLRQYNKLERLQDEH